MGNKRSFEHEIKYLIEGRCCLNITFDINKSHCSGKP